MIDLLISGLSLLIPGAGALGLWGIVIKVAARFGLGWVASATTGPVGSIVAKAAEGLIDLVTWGAKGVLGYFAKKAAEAIDHICKSVPAAALLMAVAWGAFTWGQYGRPAPEPPPSAKSAPAAPKQKGAAPEQRKQPERGPLDWIDDALSGRF